MKKLAYFKYDGTDEDYNRISGRLYTVAAWMRQMGFYTGGKDEGARADRGRFDVQLYTITIRHDVDDTELPSLEVDYENREISFGW